MSDLIEGICEALAAIEGTLAAERPATVTQTLIFDKKKFGRAEAIAWAKRNGKRFDKVDETEDSYRLRQREPGDFIADSFKTIDITDGVKAVVGHLKPGKTAEVAAPEVSSLLMPTPEQMRAMLSGQVMALSGDGELALLAGILAVSEERFLAALGRGMGSLDKPYGVVGNRAIIDIRGMLLQQGGWIFDGHADIRARIEAAAKDPAVQEIGLDIDSPGGMFAGNIDNVRAARAAITASGKPCTAWCGGSGAFSAAYAWASVADSISVSDTSGVGSIGVMRTMPDFTGALEKEGIKQDVIRSGDRKAEGHPFIPNTAGARARAQKQIDDMGRRFAEQVALGRSLDVEAVLGQRGAEFYGADAIGAGLANTVESREEWLGRSPGLVPQDVGAAGGAGAQGAKASASGAGGKTMLTVLQALGLGANASEAEARAKVEELKGKTAKLEERLKTLADATCVFVRQEALVAGRRTKAELDADAEADAELMADLAPDKVALHTLKKYELVPRGSALHRESHAEQEAGDVRPPKRREPEVELDGAKMTATEIARIKDPAVRARLMKQFSVAQRPADKTLFASVKTTLAAE